MNKKIVLLGLVLFIVCTVVATFSFAGFFMKHETVKAENGEIAIPLNEVSDGEAHYYLFKEGGQEVKFFVVKSVDGVIRAAFDACDVCYHSKKGYSQNGDFMVCNNCGREFHSNRINVVEGGCNPAPLARTERAGLLVIKAEDVLQGARYF